jgi:hypothetical protein
VHIVAFLHGPAISSAGDAKPSARSHAAQQGVSGLPPSS